MYFSTLNNGTHCTLSLEITNIVVIICDDVINYYTKGGLGYCKGDKNTFQ